MTEIEVYARSSVANIPSIVIWILLVVLIIGYAIIYLNLYNSANGWVRGAARLMLVEWVVLVFCSAVIFRETGDESAISLIPLSSYFCVAENSYLTEVAVINVLNICMFLPLGIFLKFGSRDITWNKVMVIGLVFSLAIEVSQLFWGKGLFEVDDVIHNVAGCMIGFGIAKVLLNQCFTDY